MTINKTSIYIIKRIAILFLLLFWVAMLFRTDSYYIVYLFLGFIGIIGLALEISGRFSFILNSVDWIVPGIGSIAITAANYKIFIELQFPVTHLVTVYKIAAVVAVTCAGIVCLAYVLNIVKAGTANLWLKKNNTGQKPILVFFATLTFIAIIYMFIFVLCYYPGVLTVDSIVQIQQCITEIYSNHHPFFHTMLIKFFLTAGTTLFGNINAAVALYSIFQIIFMSASFSYAIMTLYQLRINTKIISVITLAYAFMPYHIYYSFTMWKDVMFSGFTLLFIVSIFRYMIGLSKGGIKIWIGIAVSALGICLFRSNGWFVFVITTLVFWILFSKKYKHLGILFIGITILGYILTNPLLNELGVAKIDIGYYLSIPAQQISRVIVDENDLTNEETSLLSKVVDVEKISVEYKPYISDPIVILILKGNQKYLVQYKNSYLLLWAKLGLRHPVKYLEAWIDQTRGYWNGGYAYWRWTEKLEENGLGIERITLSQTALKLVHSYSYQYESINLLKIFISIGFFTWLTVLIGYIGLVKRNKMVVFTTMLLSAIIISLMIATPVYSEFRYAYALFCCVPFLAVILFCKDGMSTVN